METMAANKMPDNDGNIYSIKTIGKTSNAFVWFNETVLPLLLSPSLSSSLSGSLRIVCCRWGVLRICFDSINFRRTDLLQYVMIFCWLINVYPPWHFSFVSFERWSMCVCVRAPRNEIAALITSLRSLSHCKNNPLKYCRHMFPFNVIKCTHQTLSSPSPFVYWRFVSSAHLSYANPMSVWRGRTQTANAYRKTWNCLLFARFWPHFALISSVPYKIVMTLKEVLKKRQ